MLARKFLITGFVSLASLAHSASASAEDDLDSGLIEERNARAVFEEQTSFIIDRTITLFGSEFYRSFAETWRRLEGVAGKNLGLVERPSARWGSLIWIEHNNVHVYQAFLYPSRRADIPQLADNAARYVAARLTESELTKALFYDPDVGKEEF
jgi:curli production assembly/transport component CsgE